jgi:hypothetical protein
MLKSVLTNTQKILLVAFTLCAVSISYCFTNKFNAEDWLIYANRCLAQSYDASADGKLKKADISITNDYFIRLKKTYAKGKQEYYSFNLNKFNDMDYMGNINTGILELKTVADDIIVQTRNDRAGDVDSMTTVLNIPVKNMDPDRLDSLRQAFTYFKNKGM